MAYPPSGLLFFIDVGDDSYFCHSVTIKPLYRGQHLENRRGTDHEDLQLRTGNSQ